MVRGLAAALLAVACLAACGSGAKRAAPPTTAACPSRVTGARLRADIAALRRAARLPTSDRLIGNRAVNRATDRFLADIADARIGNLRRNRLIDHAAGTLAGACEQCFQALEAARPVVSIRLGEKGC